MRSFQKSIAAAVFQAPSRHPRGHAICRMKRTGWKPTHSELSSRRGMKRTCCWCFACPPNRQRPGQSCAHGLGAENDALKRFKFRAGVNPRPNIRWRPPMMARLWLASGDAAKRHGLSQRAGGQSLYRKGFFVSSSMRFLGPALARWNRVAPEP